jgi:hypothetical protein
VSRETSEPVVGWLAVVVGLVMAAVMVSVWGMP